MRKAIFVLAVALLVAVTTGYAAMFDKAPVSAVSGGPSESTGTFEFYYHGAPAWQWYWPDGGHFTVGIDPTNDDGTGLGDSTMNGYDVTYVDSYWNYDPEDPDGGAETELFICPDDGGGLPDFANPLYSSGPYVPEYYAARDEHQVDPPVQFLAGEWCFPVYYVEWDDAFDDVDGIPGGHPISDGDPNTGHSWAGDISGTSWELAQYNFCVWVYAEPVESVATTSIGVIKGLYQ